MRLRVAGVGPRVTAEHVAGELIEHQHERQAAARSPVPSVQLATQRRFDGRAEACLHFRVEHGPAAEPTLHLTHQLGFGGRRRAEPEAQHVFGRDGSRAGAGVARERSREGRALQQSSRVGLEARPFGQAEHLTEPWQVAKRAVAQPKVACQPIAIRIVEPTLDQAQDGFDLRALLGNARRATVFDASALFAQELRDRPAKLTRHIDPCVDGALLGQSGWQQLPVAERADHVA